MLNREHPDMMKSLDEVLAYSEKIYLPQSGQSRLSIAPPSGPGCVSTMRSRTGNSRGIDMDGLRFRCSPGAARAFSNLCSLIGYGGSTSFLQHPACSVSYRRCVLPELDIVLLSQLQGWLAKSLDGSWCSFFLLCIDFGKASIDSPVCLIALVAETDT